MPPKITPEYPWPISKPTTLDNEFGPEHNPQTTYYWEEDTSTGDVTDFIIEDDDGGLTN